LAGWCLAEGANSAPVIAVEESRIRSLLLGGRLLWPSLRDGEDTLPGLAQRSGTLLEGGAFVRGHGRVEHLLYAAGAEHADQ
jgi:hypothetical protein